MHKHRICDFVDPLTKKKTTSNGLMFKSQFLSNSRIRILHEYTYYIHIYFASLWYSQIWNRTDSPCTHINEQYSYDKPLTVVFNTEYYTISGLSDMFVHIHCAYIFECVSECICWRRMPTCNYFLLILIS